MTKLGIISHFLSPVSCNSLMLQGLRCEWGAGMLNVVLSLSLSHTGHWMWPVALVSTWHLMAKNSLKELKKRSVALHKDGVGYKIAKTLKLSCSTVDKTILAMVDQRSWVHVLSIISRGCVWGIDIWVLPALLQRLKGWGVSLSVLRPYAAHCIKLVCMAVIQEGSLF